MSYKMKPGSKEKDTPTSFNEKDSKVIKGTTTGKMSEAETKDLVDAINKKYGGEKPTPKGVNLGKFSKFVKRSTNRLQEGGAIPTYRPAKGVTRQQFENYSKQIKKENPDIKAEFKYK